MRRPVAPRRSPLQGARAKLAVRYSVALCVAAMAIVGGVYFALSESLDVEPTATMTRVESSPEGASEVRQEVDTERDVDVEGLVARETLDNLRDASLLALGVLFTASFVVGWVVAGRVLTPIEWSLMVQRRFVQDASHELRNPLAVMRTSLDVALEDPDASVDAWRSVGGGLRDTVDRMSDVVDRLLRTVRDEAPQAHAVVFDPAAVLRRVEVQFLLTAVARDITTVVQAESGRVAGDPAAMQRVVANLVDNAFRYAPARSTVRLSGVAADDTYAIRVQDSGTGIREPDPEAVFDRGHRGRDSPGLGLGLAIARDIVVAHNGMITIEKDSRWGTTLLVTLPQAT